MKTRLRGNSYQTQPPRSSIGRKLRGHAGKKVLTVALAMLLILFAALPLIYPYLTTILTTNQPTATEADPNTLPTLQLSPIAVLGYANAILGLAAGGGFGQAKNLTAYITRLPPNIQNNLQTYLQQISQLVTEIKTINDGLNATAILLKNGQLSQARTLIPRIQSELDDASSRLTLLNSALDRISEIYNVDVSSQRARLSTLASILTQFQQLLQSLKDTLAGLDKRIATELTLTATPNPVFANGTLLVQGGLKANGTALQGRTVALTLNGIPTAELTSNSNGTFTWTYNVNAARSSSLKIYAQYDPTGNDTNLYRPTLSATLAVQVTFYPVRLTAHPSTTQLYVTEPFTIRGELTNALQEPLADETLTLTIDARTVDAAQTDASGNYMLTWSFPQGALAGAHKTTVQFNPTSGVYESKARAFQMQVYYMPSSVTVTSTPPNFILSGETITLGGTVTVNPQHPPQGQVAALLGTREIGNAPIGNDGAFTIAAKIPLDVSGKNPLTLLYTPAKPWILSNQTTVPLNVLNSGLIGFASIGFVAGAVTVSSTVQLIPPTKREREEAEEAAKPAPQSIPTITPVSLGLLRTIQDPRRFVAASYWEARRVLGQAFGDIAPPSETPREFAARINPMLKEAGVAFSALTLSYEVAEYSQHEITRDHAQAALLSLGLIARELQVPVKRFQDWTEFRKECEAKVRQTLPTLGLSALNITVAPQRISIQHPWHLQHYLSKEGQAKAIRALEDAVGIQVELIPVRFCDRCRYKLEGTAVELPSCPNCGRHFYVEFGGGG